MKNKQALILLLTAHTVSGFAQGISMLAIPWYFAKNSDTVVFNQIFAAITCVVLFWGIYAGSIVDRYNRKYVFIGSHLIEGLVITGIALYGCVTGHLSYTLVGIVFAFTAFGFNIYYPNVYAFLQEISEPKDYTRATAYIEIVGQCTSMLSGAAAVILLEGIHWHDRVDLGLFTFTADFDISAWPIYHIFLADGLTYLLAILLIAYMRYKPVGRDMTDRTPLVNRIKTGFSFLTNHPYIFVFGFFSFAVFITLLVEMFAVIPGYIHDYLASAGYILGYTEMLYGLGAVFIGWFSTRFFTKHSPVNKVIFLTFVVSGSFLTLFLTRSVAVFLILSALIGIGNAGIRIYRMSYLFKAIPNHVIGRVNSILNMANVLARMGLILLFALPFYNEQGRINHAYFILTLFTTVSGLVLMVYRRRILARVSEPD